MSAVEGHCVFGSDEALQKRQTCMVTLLEEDGRRFAVDAPAIRILFSALLDGLFCDFTKRLQEAVASTMNRRRMRPTGMEKSRTNR